MDYKKYNNTIYLRLDKGDEVLKSISNLCITENILSANFSGIGGCGDVIVGTYDLEKGDYLTKQQSGLLEMVSLNGNVTQNEDNNLFVHAHAMFSYIGENGNILLLGGHLKKASIILTGEIIINPIKDGIIKRRKDSSLGISIWQL